MHGVAELGDSGNSADKTSDESNKETDKAPQQRNVVDREKLLFCVFLLLQKLGSDERPEVGNRHDSCCICILSVHTD